MLNIQANRKLTHGVDMAMLWRVAYETTESIAKAYISRQEDS